MLPSHSKPTDTLQATRVADQPQADHEDGKIPSKSVPEYVTQDVVAAEPPIKPEEKHTAEEPQAPQVRRDDSTHQTPANPIPAEVTKAEETTDQSEAAHVLETAVGVAKPPLPMPKDVEVPSPRKASPLHKTNTPTEDHMDAKVSKPVKTSKNPTGDVSAARPDNFGKTDFLSPDEQCPPKKRGRKPKSTPTEKDNPSTSKASKTKKAKEEEGENTASSSKAKKTRSRKQAKEEENTASPSELEGAVTRKKAKKTPTNETEVDPAAGGSKKAKKTPTDEAKVDQAAGGSKRAKKTPSNEAEVNQAADGSKKAKKTSTNEAEVNQAADGSKKAKKTSTDEAEVETAVTRKKAKKTPTDEAEVDPAAGASKKAKKTPPDEAEVDPAAGGSKKAKKAPTNEQEDRKAKASRKSSAYHKEKARMLKLGHTQEEATCAAKVATWSSYNFKPI